MKDTQNVSDIEVQWLRRRVEALEDAMLRIVAEVQAPDDTSSPEEWRTAVGHIAGIAVDALTRTGKVTQSSGCIYCDLDVCTPEVHVS